jgi:hypothetical protein
LNGGDRRVQRDFADQRRVVPGRPVHAWSVGSVLLAASRLLCTAQGERPWLRSRETTEFRCVSGRCWAIAKQNSPIGHRSPVIFVIRLPHTPSLGANLFSCLPHLLSLRIFDARAHHLPPPPVCPSFNASSALSHPHSHTLLSLFPFNYYFELCLRQSSCLHGLISRNPRFRPSLNQPQSLPQPQHSLWPTFPLRTTQLHPQSPLRTSKHNTLSSNTTSRLLDTLLPQNNVCFEFITSAVP